MSYTAVASSINASNDHLDTSARHFLSADTLGDPLPPPLKRRTQQDQDRADDKAKKDAELQLAKLWMDRLQLISVITTFFASVEGGMIALTTPIEVPGNAAQHLPNAGLQLANAGLAGALVFHSFAAIFSFIAAFVLMHYQLEEANRDKEISVSVEEKQEIWSSEPHVALAQRVEYLQRRVPPMHLLQRFHTLCVSMSVIGFVLAVVGMLSFAWVRQPTSVGIFSTVSLGVCILAGVAVVFVSSSEDNPK